jgi:gamma-glutamyltranspeptidase / glutathione hydrolase
MGLDTALSKYGTLSRAEVMDPAIQLAFQGFVLQAEDLKNLKLGESIFKANDQARSTFLAPDGKRLQSGDRLIQPELGNTLNTIMQLGPDGFYQGKIADTIVAASQTSGGVLTKQDFVTYSIEETPPLTCQYRQYTVTTAPLPGGGITLCQMLKILEGYNLSESPRDSATTSHRLLSAMVLSYRDRNTFLGDPHFLQSSPNTLLSNEHIETLRQQIPDVQAPQLNPIPRGPEGRNTTHFSVVDQNGMAVSVTYTLNTAFGSGLMAGDTGFFLNNQMDDFTIQLGVANEYGMIQGAPNLIKPGKRPLSSMAPTLLS